MIRDKAHTDTADCNSHQRVPMLVTNGAER
jgi:hypothetical protein